MDKADEILRQKMLAELFEKSQEESMVQGNPEVFRPLDKEMYLKSLQVGRGLPEYEERLLGDFTGMSDSDRIKRVLAIEKMKQENPELGLPSKSLIFD